MTYWHNGTDESLGMRRQRDSGVVVQNGEIHIGLLTQAKRQNRKPYYPLPSGTALERMDTVANGDVLYTMNGLNARINAMSGGGGGERHNSNKVRCASSLCGQGDSNIDGNEVLLHHLQFQGLAEQGTTDQGANSNGMFNVVRGGIVSRINETMWTIEEGDWLEMYAPTETEAKQGKGAHQHKADRLGERKLWLRTFKTERHRNTPKSIYQCLTHKADRDAPQYSKTFKATCDAYVDSVIEQTALVMSVVQDDARALELYNGLRNDQAVRSQIIDRLFKRYKPGLPESVAANASGNTLRRLEQESAGKYIAAVGDLVHSVNKNVVGRATSAALPGHMYNVQICSYSAK